MPEAAGAVDCHVVPLLVNTFPLVLGATNKGVDVPLPKMTLLAVRVARLVPPLTTGNVPVTFVVRFAKVVDVVPVQPLAIGSVPVTPVDKGRPVALVKVPLAGVPRTGATRVNDVPLVVAPVMPPNAPALLYWT
jgi:hypothetical protein